MEELKGGVTTPCRMQNRGSIIVIERRHYRAAQNPIVVVVVVISIFPSVHSSLHLFLLFLSVYSFFNDTLKSLWDVSRLHDVRYPA